MQTSITDYQLPLTVKKSIYNYFVSIFCFLLAFGLACVATLAVRDIEFRIRDIFLFLFMIASILLFAWGGYTAFSEANKPVLVITQNGIDHNTVTYPWSLFEDAQLRNRWHDAGGSPPGRKVQVTELILIHKEKGDPSGLTRKQTIIDITLTDVIDHSLLSLAKRLIDQHKS